MNQNPAVLQQMLVSDLQSPFLKEYSRRMPNIYQESASRSISDEAIDDALKSYYFGQTRYALVQSLFLSVGRECGHQADIVPCEKNGFPIPVVTVGRFMFTTHSSFDGFETSVINASLIRQQHSTINEDLIQPSLFEPEFDKQKLLAAEKIYANILFGCRGDGRDFSTYGFLRITVPYLKQVNGQDRLFFAANLDYFDVLQMVVEKEQAQQQAKPIINVATPKIKIPIAG